MASTNAFAVRHFFAGSCQAQLHRGLANLGEAFLARVAEAKATPPNDQPDPSAEPLPAPVVRAAPGQDPETQANLAGGFAVRPVRSPEEAAVAAASAPSGSSGRNTTT